ncbi:MAG: Zn-dependent hydrolase, partial [Bacteroidales bacterium]
MKKFILGTSLFVWLFSSGCCNKKCETKSEDEVIKGFAKVTLTTDMTQFSETEKQMLSYLFEAAETMEDIFWKEAFDGDRKSFLKRISNDTLRKFAAINYGPWERLNGNEAFLDGYGVKPRGANFYPEDMSIEEFDALKDPNKTSPYTLIRRDKEGKLIVVWYKDAFKTEIEKAASLLEKAAALSEDEGFKKYLTLRATALRTDDYLESDMAWMDMKNSKFDFVIGPIENYEDALLGYKAAHESFVLIKDAEWSKKLDKFAA